MGNDVFTLIVLGVVVVLYAIDKVPLVLTAILSMLVLYFKGVVSFSEAFSGFSNNAVIMIIGMQMIGAALKETGIVKKVATLLMKSRLFGKTGLTEKKFVIIGGLFVAAICVFINPVLIVLMFMEIADGLAQKPEYGITRKNTYLPIAIASNCGAMITTISSTTIIVVSSLVAESSAGRPLNFFEPVAMGIPCLIVYVLFFLLFGHKMMKKTFKFEDVVPQNKNDNGDNVDSKLTWRAYVTLGVLVVCIALFIFTKFSMGAVALAGAAVLILTGCIKADKAIAGVKWQTVILVACALGFAKGVDVSGAGLMIANGTLALFGDLAKQPFFLCLLALIVSSILSNLMNNSSAAALLVPIFITIADTAGINVVPIAMGAGVGANLACSTPICGPVFTMASSAGYRFKDYLKVGGLFNLITIIICAVSLYLVYFVF